MNKYSDYLEVVDFPSEINEHSVKDPSFRWQDTFPHKTFIDLLKAAERMLGRATSSDRKSIWIEGAYGTGKSRIAWALKTLLECSGEELKEYFNEYDDLRRETDLRDRLLGHKRGKIVTVYRYGSSEINNIRDLTMAIYEETSKALKRAKLEFCGADTLRGSILKWLELPANQEYLAALIRISLSLRVHQTCQAVCEIAVIRRNILIAYAEHRVTLICDFFRRKVHIRYIRPEIDQHHTGNGLIGLGTEITDRKRIITECAVGSEFQFL